MRRLAHGPMLTLAVGLGAALPAIVATVQGLREGLTPTGDRAIILTRAYDVLSAHTPLVGQYSASSVLYSRVVHSLGPMLYWLLALPARFGPSASPAVVIAAINVMCVLAAVALARRRGGVPLMVLAAMALALMCRSLASETLHDVWNPSAGLLPLTLLMFVSWSLACGEARLLPAAVLLASFASQCELTFLAPSIGVLTVDIVGLGLAHRLTRTANPTGVSPTGISPVSAAPTTTPVPGHETPPRLWPWALAALLVALVCWSGPILDELIHHPGNLTLVAHAAVSHGRTMGPVIGWHAVVRAIGIPPWWLTNPSGSFGRLAQVIARPGLFAVASSVVVLIALGCTLLLGLLRRRPDLSAPAAIGLLLCVALASVASSTPTRPSLTSSLGYTLWFGSPAGMFVWLTLAWSISRPAAGAIRRGWTRLLRDLPARATLSPSPVLALGVPLSLGAALAVGVTIAAGERPDTDSVEYGPVARVNAAVLRRLSPSDRTVLVNGSHDFTGFDFRAAVIYELRKHGLRVLAPAASLRLGSYYEPGRLRPDASIFVFDGHDPPGHGRTIVRLSYGVPLKTITVTIEEPSARPAPARARQAHGGAARLRSSSLAR